MLCPFWEAVEWMSILDECGALSESTHTHAHWFTNTQNKGLTSYFLAQGCFFHWYFIHFIHKKTWKMSHSFTLHLLSWKSEVNFVAASYWIFFSFLEVGSLVISEMYCIFSTQAERWYDSAKTHSVPKFFNMPMAYGIRQYSYSKYCMIKI